MKGIEQFPDFISQLPEADVPFQGVSARILQGSSSQAVFMEFRESVEVPEHSHQEQWELVLAGRVFLRLGGEEREHQAGDHFFIPAGEPHSARVEAGYKAVIFFNEPARYRQKEPR